MENKEKARFTLLSDVTTVLIMHIKEKKLLFLCLVNSDLNILDHVSFILQCCGQLYTSVVLQQKSKMVTVMLLMHLPHSKTLKALVGMSDNLLGDWHKSVTCTS